MQSIDDRGASSWASSLSRVALTAILAAAALAAGCSSPSAPPTIPVKPASSSAQTTTATVTASATATPRGATDQTASEICGCAVGTTLTVTGTGMKANVAGKPSEASVIAAAKTLLAKNEEATLSGVKVESMTRDKKGKWWALISATEESAGAVKAVFASDGKNWDERAYGLTITDTDLPSDVKF
jgi:hypothetical protein